MSKHFVEEDNSDFENHNGHVPLSKKLNYNGNGPVNGSLNGSNGYVYPPHGYEHSDRPNGNSGSAIGGSGWIDNFFHISERGSSISTEIRGGMVTFVTMAYILVVNPEVLSQVSRSKVGVGDFLPFEDVAVATALSASLGSILVGVFGNLPFGLAPGMGLNSYFTYGVCIKLGLTWRVALSTVFFQGILFMILAASGACTLIQLYAPPCIKKSITVGLGLFQALIGFECMQVVVRGEGVLLALGDLSDGKVWLGIFGLMFICVLLVINVKGAMFIGMVIVTLIAWIGGFAAWPNGVVSFPTMSKTFFALDFDGFFEFYHITIPVTLVFLFVSIFDTAGVQFAAGQQAGILDHRDHLPGATAAFLGAGISTAFGALLGTSPVIIHNETCAGIQDGARTGLAAVTTGILFLFSLPFIPILTAVPPIATAAPLVIVGMFMMSMSKFIDWESVDEAMPAFLTATVLPLTYSIANGMVCGLVAYVILKTATYFVSNDDELNQKHMHLSDLVREGILDPVPGTPKPPFIRKSTQSPTIHGDHSHLLNSSHEGNMYGSLM